MNNFSNLKEGKYKELGLTSFRFEKYDKKFYGGPNVIYWIKHNIKDLFNELKYAWDRVWDIDRRVLWSLDTNILEYLHRALVLHRDRGCGSPTTYCDIEPFNSRSCVGGDTPCNESCHKGWKEYLQSLITTIERIDDLEEADTTYYHSDDYAAQREEIDELYKDLFIGLSLHIQDIWD
jgi:hypothetical protein